jgi:hypothetical protein
MRRVEPAIPEYVDCEMRTELYPTKDYTVYMATYIPIKNLRYRIDDATKHISAGTKVIVVELL